jgi:Tol biopolymer transport system component
VRFEVSANHGGGAWLDYDPVVNRVAEDEVDPWLAFRWLNPGFRLWRTMQIRQRHLESFERRVVVDNSFFRDGCVNCHTFLNGSPALMTMQVRPGYESYGSGIVMLRDGALSKISTRTDAVPNSPTYMAWHPDGNALAFSSNKVKQVFHSRRIETREVIDLESNMALYLADTRTVVSHPAIARPDRLETWPAWSPDGAHLYFSSAHVPWASDNTSAVLAHHDEVRYDLMRVACDLGSRSWGEPETVLSSEELGLSFTQPKVSPDGRYLLCTGADYGCFPIFHPSADLYMVYLETGEHRRLEINSDESDSWHSWSSNGRWIVFSSKRRDGLFARPHFAYVDHEGKVHKPFVLPQEDPTYYDSLLRTYNVPELIREPIPADPADFGRAIRADEWVPPSNPPATQASPVAAGYDGPWQVAPE